jgi:hypothetical protein
MSYRFKIEIVEEGSSEHAIESDWCTLDHTTIHEFGGCEAVDKMVGKMLRNWRNFAREEYERYVYGETR